MSRPDSPGTVALVILVAIGGALGANARYFVGTAVSGLGGTFVANVLGCFSLGLLVYGTQRTDLIAERAKLLLGTGFLSSFTTYSTFALETAQSEPVIGVGYVVASYAVGFTAVLVGRSTALHITPDPSAAGRTGECDA